MYVMTFRRTVTRNATVESVSVLVNIQSTNMSLYAHQHASHVSATPTEVKKRASRLDKVV